MKSPKKMVAVKVTAGTAKAARPKEEMEKALTVRARPSLLQELFAPAKLTRTCTPQEKRVPKETALR